MNYEPTTRGESEDMPDIFQQLLEAAEEEEEDDDDDDDDEFHGLMEHRPTNLICANSLIDAIQGYTTIEVDIGGDEEDATETEVPQGATTIQPHGRLGQAWV